MTKNIVELLKEAQGWDDIDDILNGAKISDLPLLEPIIPDLIEHRSWVVRTTTLELIGRLCLKKYVNLVRERLDDRIIHVRCYALMSLYDLLKSKSMVDIWKFCEHKNVGIRVTALALAFIETKDPEVLTKLAKIIVRKRCNYLHQSAVFNIFDAYIEFKDYSEIVKLYKEMLKVIPKTYGIAKDLKKSLKQLE